MSGNINNPKGTREILTVLFTFDGTFQRSAVRELHEMHLYKTTTIAASTYILIKDGIDLFNLAVRHNVTA